jgi:hypothetical protein
MSDDNVITAPVTFEPNVITAPVTVSTQSIIADLVDAAAAVSISAPVTVSAPTVITAPITQSEIVVTAPFSMVPGPGMLGHDIQIHTDTNATGTQLNELVGGGLTSLHWHGQVTTHEATYNHANFQTAYGWGDHSLQNYGTTPTEQAFAYNQTAAGVINITHTQGTKTPHVVVYDESFHIVEPDDVIGISTTVVQIILSSRRPWTGNYYARIS